MEEKNLEEAHQFVDYLIPNTLLSWKSPRREGVPWVFWTEDKPSTSSDPQISIQNRIKTALLACDHYYFGPDVLVQFWASTIDEGSVLTTVDQPFALNRLTNEKLNHYKKNSPSSYKFVDLGEEEELTDGPICRVYRTELPEKSIDISYYSVKECPERDFMLECGLKSTLIFPLFEPTLECCVGVIEFLFTKNNSFEFAQNDYYAATIIIEVAGLKIGDPSHTYFPEVKFIEEEELKGAMDQVRETHGLPLVNVWTRGEHISSVGSGGSLSKSFNTSDLNSREEFLYPIPKMEVYDRKSLNYYNFVYLTLPRTLGVSHKAHDPVDKVFYFDQPCFCRDVARLSIIDYPMAHLARRSGLKSCFAVCLQSVVTGNRVCALEFFLPPDTMHSGDLHNILSSILMTLKQHLKSFEVVSGDIGNELFNEIDSLTELNVEDSMVKEKNVIVAEQGNTSFTQNTLNASSGHETEMLSTEFTSFHTISLSNTYSGYETISSSGEFTSYKTISISAQGAESGNETISSSGEFTSNKTISISAQGAEDSARSLRSRSIESTLNNTDRKLKVNTRLSGNKSYFDRSASMINEHMDSETGSSSLFKLFGRTLSVSQYQVPRMNVIRGDFSLSSEPRSEGSAVVPHTVPPWSTVDVEMIDENENYEDDL